VSLTRISRESKRAKAVAGMSFARRNVEGCFWKVVFMWSGRVVERVRREFRIVGGTTWRASGDRIRVISWETLVGGKRRAHFTLYIAKSAFWTQGANAGELNTR